MLKKPRFSPAQPRRAKTRHSAGKAAASEEARRYHPHFVWPFATRMDLGERKIPSSTSEPLSAERAPMTDFFSILLRQPGPLRKRGSLPDSPALCIHDIPDQSILDEKAASC